jgi:hypothetical protein
VPGTVAHTEIRYVLTLHWILPIFAGVTVITLPLPFAIGAYLARSRLVTSFSAC